MRSFTRQKKIYCGDKYLEVDIFPYTETQQEATKRKRGKRSKKEKVTEPKQRNLNDKNAKRYFVQLINANFGAGDLHVSFTYSKEFLPTTIEEAEKEAGKYLRRISYRMKKEGLGALKYVLVTEGNTRKRDGKLVRVHHHLIMNGGLDRDIVEDLWSRKKQKGQKKGERIGYVNADRLQEAADGSGITALGKYLTKENESKKKKDEKQIELTKDPNGKKRWSSSQNLDRPWSRNNDSKYRRRELERLAKDQSLVDVRFWEKQYPGWTLVNNEHALKLDYNEHTGWSVYLQMRRRE